MDNNVTQRKAIAKWEIAYERMSLELAPSGTEMGDERPLLSSMQHFNSRGPRSMRSKWQCCSTRVDAGILELLVLCAHWTNAWVPEHPVAAIQEGLYRASMSRCMCA